MIINDCLPLKEVPRDMLILARDACDERGFPDRLELVRDKDALELSWLWCTPGPYYHKVFRYGSKGRGLICLFGLSTYALCYDKINIVDTAMHSTENISREYIDKYIREYTKRTKGSCVKKWWEEGYLIDEGKKLLVPSTDGSGYSIIVTFYRPAGGYGSVFPYIYNEAYYHQLSHRYEFADLAVGEGKPIEVIATRIP